MVEDNSCVNNSHYSRRYRVLQGVIRMPWCSWSPDMDPMEYVWSFFERRLCGAPVENGWSYSAYPPYRGALHPPIGPAHKPKAHMCSIEPSFGTKKFSGYALGKDIPSGSSSFILLRLPRYRSTNLRVYACDQ